MTREMGTWVLAVGGVLFAFGLLREYSILFAEAGDARNAAVSGDGGFGLIALVVGAVLLAAGWWLRRNRPAS
jgi:uncharacterized membrane protein